MTTPRSLQSNSTVDAAARRTRKAVHDLNNLLMIIDSYSRLLIDSSNDWERVVEYAKKIQNASTKAASVTHQLLALSRKQKSGPAILDLNQVVSELSRTFPAILRRNVTVQMELDPDIGTIRANRNQVEQIIMSLVVHANDGMVLGGSITIETNKVQVGGPDRPEEHSDTSPGTYAMLAVLAGSDCRGAADSEKTTQSGEPLHSDGSRSEASLTLRSVSRLVKRNCGFVREVRGLAGGGAVRVYMPTANASVKEGGGETAQK